MVIHPHRGAEARPEFGGSMAEAAQPEWRKWRRPPL